MGESFVLDTIFITIPCLFSANQLNLNPYIFILVGNMNCLILVVVTLVTTCVAQQSSVYTFQRAGEGESWIQYKPTWSRTQQPRFDFSFRTKRANSFVFSMNFAPVGSELTLWGNLKKGELHVTLNTGGDEFTLKAGKGKYDHLCSLFFSFDSGSGGNRINEYGIGKMRLKCLNSKLIERFSFTEKLLFTTNFVISLALKSKSFFLTYRALKKFALLMSLKVLDRD